MPQKSPIKTLEKDIIKAEKAVKRNWKRITLIIFVSLMLISAALFMTGLRLRFELRDTLILHLTPPDKSFTMSNEQKGEITFQVSTENSMFCTAQCTYAFYDRSEEKILDKGALKLKNKETFDKTYTLTPYTKGSGQKIYNFEVKCSNIKSFLCSTKSPLRQRFSFITLNYKLSEKEQKIKSELNPLLKKDFVLINNASRNLQKAAYILNKTDSLIEIDKLNKNYLSAIRILNDTLKKTEYIFDLWSKEEYLRLESFYKQSMINNSNLIFQTSNTVLNNTLSSINHQNNLIKNYNNQKNNFFNISKDQEYYAYYSSSNQSLLQEHNTTYNYLNKIKSNLIDKEYSYTSELIEALLNLSTQIKSFTNSLNKNFKSIDSIGKNLSLSEYSKKCYLGYCENLTNSTCSDLADIFTEYESTAYKPENISIPNTSYYKKINSEVQILVSNNSKEYYNKYCLRQPQNLSFFKTDIKNIRQISIPDTISITFIDPIQNELSLNLPVCCVYAKCSPCCTTEQCKNDPSSFPVILIHGHSLLRKASPEPALDIFSKVQYQLQKDGYLNGGTVLFDFNISDYSANDWGLSGTPIAVKGSYYYDYFYSLGKYLYITKSTDNLDTYTIRLKDIIELVKFRTGKPKVNLISHSMGGLVARRYIQIFGDSSVDKFILIATPNKGIEGSAKKFCRIFGEKRECEDMYSDSIFLKKLNDPNKQPKHLKIYTISGIGCNTDGKDGDGVITLESSTLNYATSFKVKGKCDDTFKRNLHGDLLDIDKYGEVYGYIKDILEEASLG